MFLYMVKVSSELKSSMHCSEEGVGDSLIRSFVFRVSRLIEIIPCIKESNFKVHRILKK